MDFGWKFLIPLTLVNIVSAAIWVALLRWGPEQGITFTQNWAPVLRWGVAFVVTLAVNVGAYIALARIFAAAQAGQGRIDLDEYRDTLTATLR